MKVEVSVFLEVRDEEVEVNEGPGLADDVDSKNQISQLHYNHDRPSMALGEITLEQRFPIAV